MHAQDFSFLFISSTSPSELGEEEEYKINSMELKGFFVSRKEKKKHIHLNYWLTENTPMGLIFLVDFNFFG